VVFHGFAGFGEDELIYKVAPYFGWINNVNIKKYYKDLGTEFYCPSLSSVSSMWDRCCEMYAHLVGGTVDYGKAHSEKYGHKRFGRTYEALIPEWGQLDDEGKIKKINVMGHSYGGPTVRYFVHLMTVGDEAERAATPEDELSGLFKGGHANWIHSCTTLAGANDGISFMYGQEMDSCWGFLGDIDTVKPDIASCLADGWNQLVDKLELLLQSAKEYLCDATVA